MRRVRRVYRARHAALTQGLGALAPALRPVPSSAGLHVCVELPGVARGTAQHVQEAAAVAGVAVSTLDRFCVEDPREGLVLGFGAIPAEQIPDGLRVLGRTLHRFGLDVGARA
jgi:GntR family transcriptional regulator/MocR family aminotransferase